MCLRGGSAWATFPSSLCCCHLLAWSPLRPLNIALTLLSLAHGLKSILRPSLLLNCVSLTESANLFSWFPGRCHSFLIQDASTSPTQDTTPG